VLVKAREINVSVLANLTQDHNIIDILGGVCVCVGGGT
jgi:hypothetical protein